MGGGRSAGSFVAPRHCLGFTQQGAVAKRNVATQTACMSMGWFRSRLSLSLLQEGSRDATCACCEQVDDLLSLVAQLKGGGGEVEKHPEL